MVSIKLSERDERIIEIHSNMYPFVNYEVAGDKWTITSCDYDEEFDTYNDFIEFISVEVKEALLQYAIDGELGELVEI